MTKKQDLYSYFQSKRLMQIFWATEVTAVLIFMQRLYLGVYYDAFLTAIIIIVLMGVYKLAQQQRILTAATYLLSILTLFMTYFIWGNSGIFDEAMLAYPCILIMAVMIGNKKLFAGLVIFISLSTLLNGFSNQQGWYINQVINVNFDSALLMLMFIWLSSYAVWVLFSDFQCLLKQLAHENSAVINSKKEIENLLHHDILTGLPNRMKAEKIFNETISRCQRNDVDVFLMFIDLDNFKLINDGLGHQAGDALLKELSQRLQKTVRDSDTVCRFAGDEFIIILQSAKRDKLISHIAHNIITAIQTPFYYQSNELICSCSIGISVPSMKQLDFDSAIQYADTAMYHSKSIGGNSFHFFDTQMDSQGLDYLNIVSDLRKALKEDQFTLHFQPKIDLKNKEIVGAEALIRWNHPEKGLIYPDHFIPQAEKSGLIVDIGAWVIESACKACKSWQALGFESFSMAVNVSSQQFKRGDFSTIVENSLTNNNLRAEYLEIEMTESLLIENSNQLKQTVKYLSNLGVSFSIDDFGTGYSNLSYIKEFEIELLKIDRSFLKDIEDNPKNKALVTAIIQMAKGLSLQTVAEGIESKEIANMLTEWGCDYAQGYHWSKPISAQAFIDFTKTYSPHNLKLVRQQSDFI